MHLGRGCFFAQAAAAFFFQSCTNCLCLFSPNSSPYLRPWSSCVLPPGSPESSLFCLLKWPRHWPPLLIPLPQPMCDPGHQQVTTAASLPVLPQPHCPPAMCLPSVPTSHASTDQSRRSPHPAPVPAPPGPRGLEGRVSLLVLPALASSSPPSRRSSIVALLHAATHPGSSDQAPGQSFPHSSRPHSSLNTCRCGKGENLRAEGKGR